MKCDCGTELVIGMWPFCNDHSFPTKDAMKPFVPYFDYGLGVMVTSNEQRNKLGWKLNLVERNPPCDTPAKQRDFKEKRMWQIKQAKEREARRV